MVFDRDRDTGDELEDYGDELASDYREEGEEEAEAGECPTRLRRALRG